MLVPAGRTAEFLAPYPVSTLGDEALAELLGRLGLPTVGAFAALPSEAVADRFGPSGTVAHRLARGLQPRPLVPRDQEPDLAVEQRFDPPEPLAEPLVFVARTLAEALHGRLAGAGLTCRRVAVEVACADGRTASRLWRHEGRLSATALAERVRSVPGATLLSTATAASWGSASSSAQSYPACIPPSAATSTGTTVRLVPPPHGSSGPGLPAELGWTGRLPVPGAAWPRRTSSTCCRSSNGCSTGSCLGRDQQHRTTTGIPPRTSLI